jgi:hypothetical protein
MKASKYLMIMFCTIIAIVSSAQKQSNCNKGDNGGPYGCNPDIPAYTIQIEYRTSTDPNEIIGPPGYDTTIKWVSSNSTLPYKILFENSAEHATAPAQKVTIYMPIDPNLNPGALQISDFGFGSFVFNILPNTNAYSQRIDLRDSLGVFLDVTAGLDMTNRRAFWIFESIDPATGLANTVPADRGFLPINDSITHKGEGFVSLMLKAGSSTHTRDSISGQATIIFDKNAPIPTNIENNLIDAVAPISKVNPLPGFVESEFTVAWSGKDDSLGVGLKSYDLYVSKNFGPFGLYRERLDSSSIKFTGEKGASYGFFTLASDHTGNKEATKKLADQTVTVIKDGIRVAMKAFLNGPYLNAEGIMTDSLRCKRLIPELDPYQVSIVPAKQITLKAATGLFDTIGNKAITDWVQVELRSKANPAQVVSRRAALIRRDGSVVDMDGEKPIFFNNIQPGQYYLALRHRNHLGVMTASTVYLDSLVGNTIDFTSPLTATYGTNAQNIVNGVTVMWGGDITNDGNITYNNSGSDKSEILRKVGLSNANGVVMNVYDKTDLNLDGNITYNGKANDKSIILISLGIGTPNTPRNHQLPQ